MTTFKRIKIVATVETGPMLLGEDQIGRTLDELRERLTHLDLAILSIEPKEPPPVDVPKSLEEELY